MKPNTLAVDEKLYALRIKKLRSATAYHAVYETLCTADAMLRILGHADAADALMEQRDRVLNRALNRIAD